MTAGSGAAVSPSGLFRVATWERELEATFDGRLPRWYRDASPAERQRRFRAWVRGEAAVLAAHLARLLGPDTPAPAAGAVRDLLGRLAADVDWAGSAGAGPGR